MKLSHILSALTAIILPDTLFAQAQEATPVSAIKVMKGFKVELLYSVPKQTEGSWVSMTQDDKGRLLASDQYGAFYRITPSALNAPASDTKIEKLNIEGGHAQGMMFHDGVLYFQVNDEALKGRGLYRARDTNGDGDLDIVEPLRIYEGKAGEHGPHGVVLAPDGKSLYTVTGNQSPVTELASSRVPRHWNEDQLFPMLLGRGFMRDVLAPGGWIAKVDFDGKGYDLINTGFRNVYDGSFNHSGDMFVFDADMEWDTSTPWYRPTRVCMVQSGGEYGWRTCSKKWPVRWEDSLPPIVDIGPGSPTGVVFGYGAKFPAKLQDALFINDWSYGKMYAVHLEPEGAGYKGVAEEFMSASPLPLTDIEVSRKDGAMYVSIGGRKVQSGLYRVTYVGNESTEPSKAKAPNEAHSLRTQLEAYHGHEDPKAIEFAWKHLGSSDRLIRFAARIAVEHQPIATWQDKALDESDARSALTALMALCRSSKGEKTLQPKIIAALNRLDIASLKGIDKVTLIRDYMLAFTRMGEPDAATKEALIKRLSPSFPQADPMLSKDVCELLVYLGDSSIVSRAVPIMSNAPTQEEQMDYARILRFAKSGWAKADREAYFKWFLHAANYKGGASFDLFIGQIKTDALAQMSDAEKAEIQPVLDMKPDPRAPSFTMKPMAFVKNYTITDLEKSLGVGLEGNRDFTNGRNMFGTATCFACHRFKQEGGTIGPDLTSVSGKYSPHDLLEHVINPSKEISDQYGSTVFTMKDGSQISGRIANMKEVTMMVCTNMMDPNNFTNIDSRQVVKMEESKVSMMPPGLLNMLKEDDILDLFAYLLSQGNPDNPMFKK
jgi:putative heme-binding domain-containing protein